MIRENEMKRTHVYLRQTSEGYALYTLGKNGEPVPNRLYTFDFKVDWKTRFFTETLQSDSEGKIMLGELKDVRFFTLSSAPGESDSVNTSFVLKNSGEIRDPSGPKSLVNAKIGETIVLSADTQSCPGKTVKLYTLEKVASTIFSVLENLDEKIVEDKERGVVRIEGLEVGCYNFRYLKTNLDNNNSNGPNVMIVVKSADLCVINNSYWFDNKHNLYQMPPEDQLQNVNLNEFIDVKNYDESTKKLKLKVFGFNKNTRLHLFSSTFRPEGDNWFLGWKDLYKSRLNHKTVITPMEFSANEYSMNRRVGDEILYAMQRKKLQPSMGITSEKPGLMLKWQENRVTSYNAQDKMAASCKYDDYQVESDASYEDDINFAEYYGGGNKAKKMQAKKKKKALVSTCQQNLYHETYNKYLSCDCQADSMNYFEKLRHFVKDIPACFSN